MNKSAIRILHASPGTPAVDVYVNNDLVVQDLSYEEITDFYTVLPGEYNIKVLLAGETTSPIIDGDIVIPDGEVTTLAAVGILPQIGLLTVVQTEKCPPAEQAMVRFVHLSPDAPKVDITLPDTSQLFSQVEYYEVADYVPITAGDYCPLVHPAGSDNVIQEMPGITLEPEHLYTIYLLGRLEGQPDLKAVITTDSTAFCVREAVPPSAPLPLSPDVKPYRWNRVQIKVHFR